MPMAIKMKSLMKLSTFSIWLASCMLLAAERETLASKEVVDRLASGIKEAYPSIYDSGSPQREAIRRRALDGLNDAEKIRGLAEYMFSYPKPGIASIPSEVIQLLISPRREIEDITELRRLMAAETDPNRFYLLSEFATLFEADYGESFMVERSRGLLMHGPAATKRLGQSPYRLGDVSCYTYDRILSKLKRLNSPFVGEILPTLQAKPEEEKVLAMAKWLKANWPGCEGLAVPGMANARPTSPESRPDKKSVCKTAANTNGFDAKQGETKGSFPPRWVIFLTVGILLLAASFHFLRRSFSR